MNIANILTLLTLLAGVVASAWGVYSALIRKLDDMDQKNDDKIKRIYERQDQVIDGVNQTHKESIEKIEKEFMRIDAHNLSMEHVKEVMEIKSNATIQLFTTQLANLSNNIKDLVDRVNHRENEK